MTKPIKPKKKKFSDELVQATMLTMCVDAGLGDSVRPEKIAQELYPEDWQSLLKRIRLMAKQMAQQGWLEILRKGKVVDPEDFKGIITLRVTIEYLEYLEEIEQMEEEEAWDDEL